MTGETRWLTVVSLKAQAARGHIALAVLSWCLYVKEQVIMYGPDKLFLGILCIAVGKYPRNQLALRLAFSSQACL